jgi:tripartite-type tricarboxylate transporter receptor subunit TctC
VPATAAAPQPTVAASQPTAAPSAPPQPTLTPPGGISEADLAKEADFFKGKNVDFVVPYATGGGYDTWVRVLAPFMKKYTGANWIVKNVPGAGSLVGTNQIYAADPNGLTVGIINGVGVTQAQLTDTSGVQYDLAKFSYLGRITTDQRLLTVSSKGKYKTIDDMRKATDKIKFGAPGPGSSNFVESVLIATALGIKIDMVTGYDVSDEVDLAVVRGDLEVAAGSYSSKLPMMKSGDLIAVLQYGKEKIADLPNVPILTALPNVSDEGKGLIAITLALGEIGRPIVGPPGIPAARLKFLEIALKKSLEDRELLDLITKQKMEVLYLPSVDTSVMAKAGVGLTAEQKKRLQDLLKQYTPTK